MAKREKRLQKRIDSIKEQIDVHEEKKKQAEVLGAEDLVGYYEKEIVSLEERKKEREEKRDRKK